MALVLRYAVAGTSVAGAVAAVASQVVLECLRLRLGGGEACESEPSGRRSGPSPATTRW
ncbi:hypothetical protein [Streptomyces sp. NPDC046859]|uniref:hypothetical protein n=1 Tax=Streptomyces sp. NPDC046859 TaxID=3155734 RepID=UPI00340FDF51